MDVLKELTYDFGQNLEISPWFVLGQNEPWDNIILMIMK